MEPILFRACLEAFLFDGPGTLIIGELTEPGPEEIEWVPPREAIPERVTVRKLPPGDEAFTAIDQLPDEVLRRPIYLIPDMTRLRQVPEHYRNSLTARTRETLICELLCAKLPRDSRLGVMLPNQNLTLTVSWEWRKHMLETHHLDAVVFHADEHGLPVQPMFNFASLFWTVNPTSPKIITRFFQALGATTGSALADLEQLSVRQGGQTQHGYVLREPIPPHEPITFDKFHPQKVRERQEVRHVGRVRPLGELVDQVPPLIDHRNVNAQSDDQANCIVLHARDIAPDSLSLEPVALEESEAKVFLSPAEMDKHLLREGDICLRSMVAHGDRIPAAEVRPGLPPMVAGRFVIALRPRQDVSKEDRDVLLSYLRSKSCLEALRTDGPQIQLGLHRLMKLEVPVPDDELRSALRSIAESENLLDVWRSDALAAWDNLFEFTGVSVARDRVLSVGRRLRQRVAAARLVDDLSHRIRSRMPHPLAYRWRTLEASTQDLEGYIAILEAAEAAVQYMASLIVVLVAKTDGLESKQLEQLRTRLQRDSRRGITFGEWQSILREANDRIDASSLPQGSPLIELRSVLSDSTVNRALGSLNGARNDQAHGRGPKGAQVGEAFEEQLEHLERLLAATEFLSEYPLRYVESVAWDSIRRASTFSYRDLVGDHPIAPLGTSSISGEPLESGSLYLVDRSENYHLLRPMLTRSRCPECGSWATFAPDTYDSKSGQWGLRSLEHGHTKLVSGREDEFRTIGLLV